MKTKIYQLLSIALLSILGFSNLYAQSDTSAPFVNSPAGGAKKFMLPGSAVAMHQFINTQGSGSTHSFSPIGIMMMPLVKIDNLLLDCGVNFGMNPDGSMNAGLVELIVYYKVTPWLSVFAGNFPPHYGVYSGILDDFTNRFGTGVAPVGMGHGVQGQNGVGIQGGVQAGYSKFTYQLYMANGPQLIVDTVTVGSNNQTGKMDYGTIIDNNKNKSFGGHIGFLPLSNSNLEVTASGQYTPETGLEGTNYQKVKCAAWALGLNYFHLFNPMMVRVIAEYNQINTGDASYMDPETHQYYTFKNQETGWFAGATVRAAGSHSWLLKNMEFAGRVGAYTPPKSGALWGGTPTNQTTFCLTEYLKWDIPLSFEYDIITQSGAPTQKIFSSIIFFRF